MAIIAWSRPTIYSMTLHKLLNDISGRVEVSSTMAALCVLGGEAEVYTDKFSFVFNTAAIEVSIQS